MKKNRTKIKLSQCMIVKNEEKNIRRALSWGKGIVSEQIVVDTGSTDRTVEIAREMGAKVFYFKWIDDFSAAKNFAIEQASGNWIAFLDADEYFTAESAKKLLSIIQNVDGLRYSGRKVEVIREKLVNVDNAGKIGVIAHQDRIFRNEPDLRYRNRIHEGLERLDNQSYVFYDAREELNIIHTGYTKEAFDQTGKTERNIRMLKKELEREPQNIDTLAYLGDSYLTKSQPDEAKRYFHQAVSAGLENGETERHTLLRSIVMLLVLYARKYNPDDEKTVRELYRNYQDMHSEHPDGECYFGFWLYQKKNYAEAEERLKTALEKVGRYKAQFSVYMSSDLKLVYAQLADCSRHLDKKDEAVRYSVMALGVDKYYTYPLIMLLNLLKGEQGEAENASGTWDILSQLYNVSSLKDQMTILKGAKLTAFPALEKRVFDAMPEGQRKAVQEALHQKAEEMRAHANGLEKAD